MEEEALKLMQQLIKAVIVKFINVISVRRRWDRVETNEQCRGKFPASASHRWCRSN